MGPLRGRVPSLFPPGRRGRIFRTGSSITSEFDAQVAEVPLELGSIGEADSPHPEAAGGFHVHGPVVNENALFRRALADFERPTVDSLFRLLDSKITGAEKGGEIPAQSESVDTVLVQFF